MGESAWGEGCEGESAAVVPQGAHMNMAPVFAVMMRACCRGTCGRSKGQRLAIRRVLGARTRSYRHGAASARGPPRVSHAAAQRGGCGQRCEVRGVHGIR